jgi:hypothetical protein
LTAIVLPPHVEFALFRRIDALAEDVGRLRRRLADDGHGLHLVDRVSGHVETLDAILWPGAGELVHGYGYSAREAIQNADARAWRVRSLLGHDRGDLERRYGGRAA